MKKSLICLLLLAAVACAAPGEEDKENLEAVAEAKAEAGARSHCLFLPECYGQFGQLHGCFFDYCYRKVDIIFYDYAFGCYCCAVPYGSPCA